MNSFKLINLFKSPSFYAGLLFFGVNLHVSHVFYHANSYKIFIVLIGVAFLYLIQTVFYRPEINKAFFKNLGIFLLPLAASLPGVLVYQGKNNYNFQYELVINLVLALWFIYLILNIKTEKQLKTMLILMGITVLYAFVRGFLEFFGWDPLLGENPVNRIKVTFGNINYLAGFIIALLPVFLAISVPSKLKKKESSNLINYFWILVTICALFVLILTKTRAAWAAGLVGIFFVILAIAIQILPKKRTTILVTLITIFAIGVLTILMLYTFHDKYIWANDLATKLRIKSIFTGRAFFSRSFSWQAALNSILSSPIIGYGLGCSYNLFFIFKNPNTRLLSSQQSYNHVHSEILEYIQEAGVIGLIAIAVFWFVILKQLYSVIKNSENDFYKKLAIGIIGGLIAYGGQSLFSVAPRMMVSKLPVITLISFSFILYSNCKTDPVGESSAIKSSRIKLAFNLVPVTFLIISFMLYIPWIQRQNAMVNYLSSGQSLFKVESFEQKTKSWSRPDIYALYHLANAQLIYNKIDKFGETVYRIDQFFPHYRQIDFWKILHAYKKNDFEKAVNLFEDQQKIDQYYLPAVNLGIKLSIILNDNDLFLRNMKTLIQIILAKYNFIPKPNIENISMTQNASVKKLTILNKDSNLHFIWEKQFMNDLFFLAKKHFYASSASQKEFELFTKEIINNLSKLDFFKIKIHKEFESESKIINSKMAYYFNIKSRSEAITQQLNTKLQEQLKKAKSQQEANQIKEEFDKQKERILLPYSNKLSEIKTELFPKIEWEDINQKRNFLFDLVKITQLIAYLPNRL